MKSRMSARCNQGAVLRLLRGEYLETPVARAWRRGRGAHGLADAFLAADEAALKTRPADGRDAEIGRLETESAEAPSSHPWTPPAGFAITDPCPWNDAKNTLSYDVQPRMSTIMYKTVSPKSACQADPSVMKVAPWPHASQ